jgi:hypothetical protein
MHMRGQIHAYEEEDTFTSGGGYMHMRRRIHATLCSRGLVRD